MRVFHVTPRRNLPSIREHGLLTRFSLTGQPRICLVHRGDVKWAIEHIKQRHECADVAVLYVDLGRKPYKREGFHWLYVERDIDPEKILGELTVGI